MNYYTKVKKTVLVGFLTAIFTTTTFIHPNLELHALQSSQQVQTNQLVPLRTLAERLGASVTWYANEKKVIVERQQGERIVLFLDKQEALVNNTPVKIAENSLVQSDKIYISLPTFNQLFSTHIEWSSESEAILFSPESVELNATQFVYHLMKNDINAINSLTNENLKASVPASVWPVLSQQLSGFVGKIRRVEYIKVEKNSVHTNVHLTYIATNSRFDFTVRFDQKGYIDDFMLNTTPISEEYTQPSYDTGNYTEENIVIGEGAFALPGTLTIPKGEGPFPVVILVHGSGPNNRDAAIGGTKVFKDIAAGLASKNIAVVRYDKVTYAHTAKVSVIPTFTIENESVDDVAKVIETLKTHSAIKQDSIFVAGHSQGGFVMPKILEQNKNIAGAILLSAPSTSFIDAIIEQQHEFVSRFKALGLEEYAALQSQNIPVFEYAKSLLNNPDFSKDNIPSDFPVTPAYWWFEMRDYVPTNEIGKYDIPLLITQGENDVQVTMQQFEGWKEALKNHKDATYISYPAMNHLLTDYDNISVGMEYNRVASVSEKLINDLVNWIIK